MMVNLKRGRKARVAAYLEIFDFGVRLPPKLLELDDFVLIEPVAPQGLKVFNLCDDRLVFHL